MRVPSGRRVWALLLALASIAGGVVLTTVYLPGRPAELARRLRSEWHWGRLELGAPTREGIRTVGFPTVRVWGDDPAQPVVDATGVRWRRQGIFPRRESLDPAGWRIAFERARVWLDPDDLRTFSEDTRTLSRWPGRIDGDRIELTWRGDTVSIGNVWCEAPRFVREGDALEVSCAVTGEGWADGTLRHTRDASGWGLDLQLDDVDLSRLAIGEVAVAFGLAWPSSLALEAGRLDLDWRSSRSQDASQSSQATVEGYQLTVGLPSSFVPGQLRFVRGSGTMVGGEVDWRIERSIYSRSELVGEGGFGPRDCHAEVTIDGVATDRSLGDLLRPFWKQVLYGVPWSGDAQLHCSFAGPRGGGLDRLFRSARLTVSGLARRGDEGIDDLRGEVRVDRDEDLLAIRGDLEPSKLRGLNLPALSFTGTLSPTSITASSAEGPQFNLRIDRAEEESIRFIASTAAWPLGPVVGRDMAGTVQLTEWTGSWAPGRGLVWEARFSLRDLEFPEGVVWAWGSNGSGPLSGSLVVRFDRGRIDVPYCALEGAQNRWELAGEVSPDGAIRLEGFRVPRALIGFRRYTVPISSADPVEVRGPLLTWTLK
ncbi:MAG: hypothetical protein AAF488_04280 [Planctomycetota bacterium]